MVNLVPVLASPRDFPEVIDLCGTWLSAPRPYFSSRFAHDPTLRKDLVLIVRDGKKIVSTSHLFEIRLVFDGHPVRCAGIGNVCTHEKWRGRGLARSLLAEAHLLAAGDGFPLTMLFTNHWKFYEAVGYRMWRRPEAVFTGLRPPADAPGVRPIDFKADVPVLRAIHDSWTPRIPAMAERTSEYWEHQTEWTTMHPGEEFRLALVSGSRAYCRGHAWTGEVKVLEFNALPDSGKETSALAAALARFAAEKCGGTIRLPAVCRELAEALRPLAAREEQAADDEMMLRVADQDALASALPGNLRPGGEVLPNNSYFWDTDGF